MDISTPSYIHRNGVAVLTSARRKYCSAAEARRASFTPFVIPTYGMLSAEANSLLKRLAQGWDKPSVKPQLRLSFAILKSHKSLPVWFSHNMEWMTVQGFQHSYQAIFNTLPFASFQFHVSFHYIYGLYVFSLHVFSK